MQVFVQSVLPKNILSPAALKYKFTEGSLSGLGCPTVDQNGNAIDDGLPCGGDTGGTTGGCPYGSSLLPDGTCGYMPAGGSSDPSLWFGGLNLPSGGGGASTTGTYQSIAGNTIVTLSNGTYLSIGPDGSVVSMSGTPPAANQGTVSNNQAAAYASIISTLTNAGVRIATVTSLPAGASLLPNGTIVGAGQSISNLNNPFGALFSNPMILIAVAFGFIMLEELAR